jgi:protein tyrosine phosphatase (PTP) superfamily phosphohydrolase (DUF442 family)
MGHHFRRGVVVLQKDLPLLQARYRRFVVGTIVLSVFIIIAFYVKAAYIDCRFSAVDDGRLYKSGFMPTDTLKRFVTKYQIKTVIDLRKPGTGDALCPENWEEIESEREILKQLGVVHAHIPSKQVPEPETLDRFFQVMDNPESYPVLLHCYHGRGRAVLFAALYRIEYLGWSVQDALSATRFIVAGSSFASDQPKGRFLKSYDPRAELP